MTRTSMPNVLEDLTKLPQDKKVEYAEKFCEGDEDLRRLLLKMWNNGIQTYASCAGHEKLEQANANELIARNNPYIYFDVNNLSSKQLEKLVESLVVLNQTSDIIQNFSFQVAKILQQERHGLTIHFNKGSVCYKMLNDIFDKILKIDKVEAGLFTKFKNFFTKNPLEISLSDELKKLVQTIVSLNEVDFAKYIDSTVNLDQEEKVSLIRFDVSKDKLQTTVRDEVKFESIFVEDGKQSDVIEVAEGMYTQDPFESSMFYTLKNGHEVIISKQQLDGLKEYKSDRKLNYTTDFNAVEIEKLIEMIKDVLTAETENTL